MFGGNFLFTRDRLGDGTFDDVAIQANLENVRYPGGTIAERYFDLRNPNQTSAVDAETGKTVDLVGLGEFMSWAGDAGVGVSIVIPTNGLLEGPLGGRQPIDKAYGTVRDFVMDVLDGKYGDAKIETLEIGNEYWLGGRQDHVEYTKIADIVARAAQDAIDTHRAGGVDAGWVEPDIAVQVGQYGRYASDPGWVQDAYIRDNLSDAAAAAIDGVIAHYYTRGSFSDLEKHEYYFDRLDGWGDDPRFRGIDYHVTEWNTDHLQSQAAGLEQVAAMTWMMSEMIAEGVDSAYVWPIQQNSRNDLGGDEGSVDLSLAGEAFRLMADLLPGTRLTERVETTRGVTYVYDGAGEHVVIASALGSDNHRVSLNLADFGYESATVTVYLIDATGDRLGPRAEPLITERTLSADDIFGFRLRDNQTAFFEIDGIPIGGAGPAAQHTGTSGNDVLNIAEIGADGKPVFAGHVDGGDGIDTLNLPGSLSDYTIYSHGDRLVFRNHTLTDTHRDGRVIATATSIEEFEGVAISSLPVKDGFAVRDNRGPWISPDRLTDVRDYDGNDLGAGSGWRHVGQADIQFDGDSERIYVNPSIGRWATVGPDDGGRVDFGDHGSGGETRVVGIYVDPLVAAGRVRQGSAIDSQTRFEKDLKADNLIVVDAFDFDADGHQEIYFALRDGTAYLRALMHADGNIQYANYQSADQVEDYLGGLGYGSDVIDAILF